MIIQIILAICSILWVMCLLANLSIHLHYLRKDGGHFGKSALSAMKFDYTSISEDMSKRDKKIYLLSFIGIIIFFFPGAYFIGSIIHENLK